RLRAAQQDALAIHVARLTPLAAGGRTDGAAHVPVLEDVQAVDVDAFLAAVLGALEQRVAVAALLRLLPGRQEVLVLLQRRDALRRHEDVVDLDAVVAAQRTNVAVHGRGLHVDEHRPGRRVARGDRSGVACDQAARGIPAEVALARRRGDVAGEAQQRQLRTSAGAAIGAQAVGDAGQGLEAQLVQHARGVVGQLVTSFTAEVHDRALLGHLTG